MVQIPDASLPKALQPIFSIAGSVSGSGAAGGDGARAALVVAGACGNVGLGKLGQFARLLAPHRIPVVALDPSPAVASIGDKLREAFGDRFDRATVDAIVDNLVIVQGGIDDLPAALRVGFVFEAIPERLPLKHELYRKIRARDPEAFIFSATSGFPSTMLFDALPGKERCGVMHPFFPHLTNKLWEVPTTGAVTGATEQKVMRRFLGDLGMTVIPVKDVAAFAADRIFCGMMLEAVRIHVDLELSPSQVDDVCKKVLGTSPFFVHNLIPGANYLSAHCMELMAGEVDSTLFSIPEAWRPYIENPHEKWPYERGQTCPPDRFAAASDRILGMMLALTAGMIEAEVAPLDALNYLCENALAFRTGTPAIAAAMGLPEAKRKLAAFVQTQGITHAEVVAPVSALEPQAAKWREIYVSTSTHDGVGLVSLKRLTLGDVFMDELGHALDAMQADPAVEAIVIAPDGTFARELGHGADLQAFVPVLGKHEAALALIQRWKATLDKLRAGKPTVAAMVGRVLGGSLELAANCHARIAGAKTRLQFPETTVGVIPGLGGCHLVHRGSASEHAARIDEVLLTGHGFLAEEAATWGFVSEVVPIPELPAASMKLAIAIARGTTKAPTFRTTGERRTVNRDVATTNEAGVVLDADLRDLLARTIEDANAADLAQGSAIEEDRAAASLAAEAAKVGVAAMLRGKPPVFPRPLG
jgi:enoyl-CoA hydratase/carnithine racemase/3-hydroxyacyl-CoA dehydrogenase